MERLTCGCEWRHAPEARRGFGGFWKKKSVELRTRLRTGRVDFRGSLRPNEFMRYGRHTSWGAADGKANIKRLCISLSYVETFNSKIIKGFKPELRSRYVFFVFRDSYVLCIYVMNIRCTFHISVSGYGTLGHSLRGDFTHSVEMLTVYSLATANWARDDCEWKILLQKRSMPHCSKCYSCTFCL